MTDKLYITSGTAVLSDSIDEGGPYTIHGVALGAGDITTGSSGVKKLWPPEELKQAAGTLTGTPLVKNHTNTVEGVIGEVTKAKWKDGVGVLYQAEVDEQFRDIAERIANGRLDVSVRAFHAPTEELEEDDETGAKVVENVKFDNLSVVPTGAAPSNTAEIGEAAEMSAAELRDAFDYESELDVEETGADVEDDSTTDEEATVTDNVSDEEASDDSEDSIESEEDELEGWSFHTPDWSGKTRGEWSRPDMGDFPSEYFGEDDEPKLGKMADHFLLSKSGFDSPDKYTDLSCPVVEPSGELSLGGLRASIGGHGVQAVDGVSEDMTKRVENWIIKTAKDEFDEHDWDGDSDESSAGPSVDEDVDETSTDAESPSDEGGLGKATIWSDDPTTQAGGIPLMAASSSDGGLTELLENISDSTMTDLEDKISEMNDPVVIESENLDELEDKAEKFETVDGRLEELGDTLDELGEAKDLVDEVGREHVEALRDSDEPTVIEQAEYDELQEAIDDVKTLYAETLSEHYPMDTETLSAKFDVLELRDMLDETEEAELAAHEVDEPEPKGGQTPEEELETTDEEIEDEETAEALREQYATHYEELGWDGVADRVRSGELSLDEMGAEL